MKKFILLLSLTILTGSPTAHIPTEQSQDVFICDSRNGKKYHFSKTCRGLSACKASIKKMSLNDARKLGKTICGWED